MVWKPGQSGNPKGRPVSSRHKVTEEFIAAYGEVLRDDPVAFFKALKLSDPSMFARIGLGLVPKEAFLQLAQVGPLDADEQEAMHEVLQAVAMVLPDARERKPGDVFALVCDALRMHTARLTIDAKPIGQIGHSARSSDNQSDGPAS